LAAERSLLSNTDVSKNVSAFSSGQRMEHTKLEGNMIPYKECYGLGIA
jgi:hypothetical protein